MASDWSTSSANRKRSRNPDALHPVSTLLPDPYTRVSSPGLCSRARVRQSASLWVYVRVCAFAFACVCVCVCDFTTPGTNQVRCVDRCSALSAIQIRRCRGSPGRVTESSAPCFICGSETKSSCTELGTQRDVHPHTTAWLLTTTTTTTTQDVRHCHIDAGTSSVHCDVTNATELLYYCMFKAATGGRVFVDDVIVL